jgi:hypothetical protein
VIATVGGSLSRSWLAGFSSRTIFLARAIVVSGKPYFDDGRVGASSTLCDLRQVSTFIFRENVNPAAGNAGDDTELCVVLDPLHVLVPVSWFSDSCTNVYSVADADACRLFGRYFCIEFDRR